MWHLGTATRFLLGIYKLESNRNTLPMPLSHSFQHRAQTPWKSLSPWPTRPSSGVKMGAPRPESRQAWRRFPVWGAMQSHQSTIYLSKPALTNFRRALCNLHSNLDFLGSGGGGDHLGVSGTLCTTPGSTPTLPKTPD